MSKVKSQKCYLAFTASFALLALTVSPIPAATEERRIERLEMLADIWGKLYLFHPRIVSADVDWSRALIETIPKIEKAQGADELVSVLNESLFKSLDDPFTIARKQNASVSPPPRRELVARKLSGTVGYIDATDPRQYGSDPAGRIEKLVRDLGPLDALIVDLRFAAPLYNRLEWLRLFLDSPQTSGGSVSRAQLARILESSGFVNSERMRQFLDFVVERALEGEPAAQRERHRGRGLRPGAGLRSQDRADRAHRGATRPRKTPGLREEGQPGPGCHSTAQGPVCPNL